MAEQKHASSKQILPLYTPAGFYMLRAPALPARIFTRLSIVGSLCLDTMQGSLDRALQVSQDNCSRWLGELAANPQIMQALAIASPSLREGLRRLRRGEGSPAQQKRARAGLLRYMIRMSTRPTPSGLFSAVALGTFADQTDAHLLSPVIARFRSRPDMSWLLAVLRKLEEDRTVVAQLSVALNQTAYLVGERAVLPCADTYGEQDNRVISLRATAVVRKVFELAQQFMPYTVLQNMLQQTFPRATAEQIEHVLWQLWEHHFLISNLHPPLTNARPANYVQQYLSGLRGVDDVQAQLARVLKSISALDKAGIGASTSMIASLVQNQNKLIPAESKDKLPLQVDAALRLQTPTLHRSIGQAAAQAAAFLLRQTPAPSGFRHLREYRSLFLEKYGEHAEVPLLDLLSPENGLDAPAGYERPPRVYQRPLLLQPPDSGSRDQALLELVTDAIFAELSYQPSQARLANVSIRPPIHSYEIVVGTTPSVPSERVLSLNDLAVGIQDGRFYIRSLRLGKQVRVCQTHMLNIRKAPDFCRFITELANDGQPVLSPFDWGAIASAPFLPRLVIKTGPASKLVITPACWQLQAETIIPTGAGSGEARWFRGLQQWREQWHVPRYVYLSESDNRLLLDLENPSMVTELRDELQKHEGKRQVTLDELLPDFEHLWLRDEQNAGYFSEIVVPLLRTDAVDPARRTETLKKTFAPQRVTAPVDRCWPSFLGGKQPEKIAE